MWGIDQHVSFATVLLPLVLYAGYKLAVALVTEFAMERALDRQGLHRPRSTLPLLGNTLDAMVFQKHRFFDWMAEQSRASEGKPWVLSIVGRPATVVLTSPEAFEDVFKTQFDVFGRGEGMLDLIHDLFGDGVLGVDGDQWQQQQRIASQLFSMRQLRDVMADVVMDKSAQLCDVLAARARSGQPVSFKSLIATFTGDVIAQVALGVDLNGLNEMVDHANVHHPFTEAVEAYGATLQARVASLEWFWKLKRLLNVGDERAFKSSAAVVHAFVHDTMRESLALKAKQQQESKCKDAAAPKNDVLSLFLTSSGVTGPSVVRDIVMNFFLAGKDTTAFSLTWFLVMVNRHPRVLHKIRDEIKGADLMGRVPTMDELQRLPYLEAAIKESLRLNMTMMHRAPRHATTLSDGTFIPEGAYVIASAYASARITSVWGHDAAEFRPERFMDEETGALKAMPAFQFISFIGGPRQCLGMRFAILEMKTALAAMLSRFDIETVEDPLAITYEFSATIPVKGDLMVDVRELPTTS